MTDTPRYRFLGAYDVGDDLLEVRYQLTGDAAPRRVYGWVSATANHFDPEEYGDDGHRNHDREGRAMTPAEVRTYAESLIDAQLAVGWELPAKAVGGRELAAADPEPEPPPATEPPAADLPPVEPSVSAEPPALFQPVVEADPSETPEPGVE
jgi:hypothetical protein